MTSIISHTINASVINQRAEDGYISATAMCKVAGKRFPHYAANDTTKAYLKALSSDVGIPTSGLIQSKRGGVSHEQGTWVHPKVALHLAQWLSPEFAVKVTNWVYDWMTGQAPVTVRAHTRKKPELSKADKARAALDKLVPPPSVREELKAILKDSVPGRCVDFKVNELATGRAVAEANEFIRQGMEAHFHDLDHVAMQRFYQSTLVLKEALHDLEGKALVKWY